MIKNTLLFQNNERSENEARKDEDTTTVKNALQNWKTSSREGEEKILR